MFYELEPEVTGGFGKNAILDSATHPPEVKFLHIELDGWLGDHLLECFPCFIVTELLANSLAQLGAVGYSLGSVEVTLSEQFRELYPGRNVPKFLWLKVNGCAGKDDFGISDENCLIVSECVFDELKKSGGLGNCDSALYEKS